MSNLINALYWAEQGFDIFPCRGYGSDYKRPEKGIKWGSGHASKNSVVIECWWSAYPNAIAALCLKDTRYMVVDCDVKHDIDGVSAFQKLLKENGLNEQQIFYVITPSGGRHYYFKIPDTVEIVPNSPDTLGANVEVKGNTSCIISGGSKTIEGLEYRIASQVSIKDTLEFPEKLMSVLLEKKNKYAEKAVDNFKDTLPINNEKYISAAFNNELAALRRTNKGNRNNALVASSFKLGTLVGGGFLSRSQCEHGLLEVAINLGLSEKEAKLTIKSGLEAGIKKPRKLSLESFSEFKVDTYLDKKTNETKIMMDISHTYGDVQSFEVIKKLPKIENYEIDSKLFNDLLNHLEKNATKRNPYLAISSVLCLLSTLMGREVYTPTQASLVLYIILLSDTGSGKDSYVMFPKKALNSLGLTHITNDSNFSSGVYLEQCLKSKPVSLSTFDEIDMFLKKVTNSKSSANELAIGATLKTIYSCSHTATVTCSGSMARERSEVIAPFFSLIGSVTPKGFFKALSSVSFSDGFLNRFFFAHCEENILTEEKDVIRQETNNLDTLPNSLREDLLAIYNLTYESANKINKEPPPPFNVPFESQKIRKMYLKFLNYIESFSSEEKEMYIRLPLMALKIATIIAVSRDLKQAKITEKDMRAGIALATESGNCFVRGKETYIDENATQKNVKYVREAIKLGGSTGVSRSDLIKVTQMVKKRDREDIIGDLLESRQIKMFEVISNHNRKKVIYKHINFVK